MFWLIENSIFMHTDLCQRGVSSYAPPSHSPQYFLSATGTLGKQFHVSFWKNPRFAFAFWYLIKIPPEVLGAFPPILFSFHEKVIESPRETHGPDLWNIPILHVALGILRREWQLGVKRKKKEPFGNDFQLVPERQFPNSLSPKCFCGFLYFCISHYLAWLSVRLRWYTAYYKAERKTDN